MKLPKVTARIVGKPFDESRGHSLAAMGDRDIQPTDTADGRIVRERIDIQPAHCNHASAYSGVVRPLPGTVKSISAVQPL